MTPRPRSSRLSAIDWVDAALDLLTADGVAAVKISRLCERLKVTKGSFYWHFADLDALWEAMAERWRETHDAKFTGFDEIASLPPGQRVAALATMLMDERNLTVEAAIRDWARVNPRVAESVRKIDSEVFDAVTAALRELDIDEERARLTAGLLVYAGIGYIHGHDALPSPTADELRSVIAGLLGA
ncbi:TetR/AcrR family transcriptional regulator [Gordonia sp. HY285]|uniref:TetR/AcrR family transcriptional regulator n=1 Tax=Gordonia liuliyuniae TaxID=2911517 RepID=A0ABS9IU11_9ACTN|nr:TetR/AcrR family transcriptional regulator [Gordonia liuliyuniae]MCF8588972.1 TetR/AcrR family transcriptional regulator [Gordonia liuliyuniae]MCF8609147.1 TetR/AcrR family transcriptional regulator [Gordonia liuliyuniae]